MKLKLLAAAFILSATGANAQNDSLTMRKLSDNILLEGTCYENLRVLCKQVGHRLSGSPQAAKAVVWGQKAMEAAGADKVWLQPVDVPHWVRGKERLSLRFQGEKSFKDVKVLSIGNTVGTDGKVLEAPVVIVKSIEDFKKLQKEEVKGKIIFFNYRFRQDLVNTFEGYGDAGKYRWLAPNMAAAQGAVGVIIRSVSTGADDEPHTGSMRYADTVKPIPAVAIGNHTADMLEKECVKGSVTAQIESDCKMLGTVPSYNVIGEIRGSEYPDKIVLVGGHLDSWDIGEGAHDDGAGCVQSIEVIRALKAAGIRPKYTVRAVLFMNEENGLKGGLAYADSAKANNETHILAIETDAGGFSPRGFSLEMKPKEREHILQYKKLFAPYGIHDFDQVHGGADISPLQKQGVPVGGLIPDAQRYFDLHHTNADVFEQVNHRELKMGAVALTQLVYLVSKYGMR